MSNQPPLVGPDRDIRTVVIDPPWGCERGGGGRGCQNHYDTLTPDDCIRVIQHDCEPWQRLADTAHMYLWATNRALALGHAHQVLEGLGFRPVTVLTWAKDKMGLGQYFRGKTEQILFGVRGETRLTDGTHTTLLEAERGEHSAKPDAAYEMIEEASPGEYLDIFARRQREGWVCWGEEVEQ